MSDGLAKLLQELRTELSGKELENFDNMMRDAAALSMRRYKEMDATVRALAVLHRDGTGAKAGFCLECGNVSPCQTMRFIQRFVEPQT